MDGVRLIVVIGDGKLITPVDFAICWPAFKSPGARCQNKLEYGAQVMLDHSLNALLRHGLHLLASITAADSWFNDSKLIRHVSTHQGTSLVQGKSTYAFALEGAKRSKTLI